MEARLKAFQLDFSSKLNRALDHEILSSPREECLLNFHFCFYLLTDKMFFLGKILNIFVHSGATPKYFYG